MVNQQLPIVYVVDGSVAVTGALIAARQTARAMADSARVVLVLPRGSAIAPQDVQEFWRVEYVPLVGLSRSIRVLVRYIPALLMSSWQIRQLMKRDGATRLQLNDFYLMQGALLRLLGFRGHIVSWVRGAPRRFAGPLAGPILWMAHCSANRMVAVSAFIQSLLPSGFGAEVIYEYYEGQARPVKSWQVGEAKKLIYVGNYIPGKGQDMALAAFAEAATRDATLMLHFYGGDMGLAKNREYRQALEATVQQRGLASRVSFHAFTSDVASVLADAYAALNFSASESFSMTVLEASGAGVPVIATASGGPQEIMHDGVTGYLIPVGDVAAAASRILALAADTTVAVAMGRAGAEHIRAHFSKEDFQAQLLSVLALT